MRSCKPPLPFHLNASATLLLLPLSRTNPSRTPVPPTLVADHSGNGEGNAFEVPKIKIKFTKLFINGQFVDAVSISFPPPLSDAAPSPPLSSTAPFSPSPPHSSAPAQRPLPRHWIPSSIVRPNRPNEGRPFDRTVPEKGGAGGRRGSMPRSGKKTGAGGSTVRGPVPKNEGCWKRGRRRGGKGRRRERGVPKEEPMSEEGALGWC